MPENEFELRSMLADAKLSVAERLGWSCALVGLPSLVALSGSWWISIIAAVVIYIVATYQYKKDASVAEDAYHRHAGLGKYFVNSGATEKI
jgi:4-hydroxybenzoate polyprenyltransferase